MVGDRLSVRHTDDYDITNKRNMCMEKKKPIIAHIPASQNTGCCLDFEHTSTRAIGRAQDRPIHASATYVLALQSSRAARH